MYMLLSIVQIVTEMIPISSAAHVSLAYALATVWGSSIVELPKQMDELLHLSPLLIVAWYFFNSWRNILVNFVPHLFLKSKSHTDFLKKRMIIDMVMLVLISFGVTVFTYFFKKFFLFNTTAPWLLALGLIITSGMLLAHYQHRWKTYGAGLVSLIRHKDNHLFGVERYNPIAFGLLLGLAQSMGLLLCTSRFAGTVTIGLLAGLRPQRALAASWMIFTPALLAAVTLNGLPWFFAEGFAYFSQPVSLITSLLSFVLAAGVFSCVARMLQENLWWLFGVYLFVPITLAIGLVLN